MTLPPGSPQPADAGPRITTLQVVGSRTDRSMSEGELIGILDRFQRLVVDVGTGDARAAYAAARTMPNTLVVGIDTAADNMRETARRAARKPAKGGLDNLLLVRASAESPPPSLLGRADEVRVVMPWGSLLSGIVDAGRPTLQGLADLGRPGATYRLILNCEVWLENTPVGLRTLTEATPDSVLAQADQYSACGLRVVSAAYLSTSEVSMLSSTWVRRLLSSRESAKFLQIEAEREPAHR